MCFGHVSFSMTIAMPWSAVNKNTAPDAGEADADVREPRSPAGCPRHAGDCPIPKTKKSGLPGHYPQLAITSHTGEPLDLGLAGTGPATATSCIKKRTAVIAVQEGKK